MAEWGLFSELRMGLRHNFLFIFSQNYKNRWRFQDFSKLHYYRHVTRWQGAVANIASYVISSSMILVIHDNMINGTNHIV
jgi:hypothetical protein